MQFVLSPLRLAFGGTLDRRCHFKHVSLKQSRFCRCQMSTAHRQRIKVDGSVATRSIKIFPIGLHVVHLYFPDTPRILGPLFKALNHNRSISIVLLSHGFSIQSWPQLGHFIQSRGQHCHLLLTDSRVLCYETSLHNCSYVS
jgi:hypothetical protein